MPLRRLPRRRPAFSLLELLVVLAVVAVLLGLLLPALTGARDAAKAVACLSNLRQVGVATEAYTEDHADHLPYAVVTGVGASGGGVLSWDDLLDPHLGGTLTPTEREAPLRPASSPAGVLRCPADDAEPVDAAARSYAMIGDPDPQRADDPPDPLAGAAVVTAAGPDAARPLLLFSQRVETLSGIAAWTGHPVQNLRGGSAGAVIGGAEPQLTGSRRFHGTDANRRYGWGFLDGHVEQADPRDTLGTGTPAAPRGWWTLQKAD